MTVDWNPLTELEKVNPNRLRYSRGLLKANPEKWFPALLAYWLPIFETIGTDYKINSINVTENIQLLKYNYLGKFDEDLVSLSYDADAARVISEITTGISSKIIYDYFAIRMLKTLVLSWTGRSLGKYSFLGDGNEISPVMNISVNIEVSGRSLTLNFLLSKGIADKLDLLWRRQIVQAVLVKTEVTARLQFAEVMVPNNKLNEYLTAGTMIDVSNVVDPILIINNQPWKKVNLIVSGNNFGITCKENVEAKEQSGIAIDLMSFKTDTVVIAELGQSDAGLDLGIPASNKVKLSIAGQPVGIGKLVEFQGKLAVEVLPKG